MKQFSKDAKGFVRGVMSHIKRNGKAGDVMPRVQSLLFKMSDSARREQQAKVESAVKLSEEELLRISRVLSDIAHHQVSIDSKVNPDLIGGLRITMADWVMDMSMKNELKEMSALLIRI